MTDDPGHTTVLVSDRQDRPVDTDALVSLAREVLEGEGEPGCELSLSFVESDEMAELHERYMGEPGPTDVLSFRMDEEPMEEGARLLGDVVICPEYAAANNPDIDTELRLLVVHGILHLLGHDHEEPDEKAVMWARQSLYVEVVVP
jgi:probable rRNA maturation factor